MPQQADPARPRKLNSISYNNVYIPLWHQMNQAWSESVLHMRDLGSGTPTIAHNNESHRIALLTNDAIKQIDPTDNIPWEMNRYKYAPVAHANEVFVRLPWEKTVQERDFLAGIGAMDWGDKITGPGEAMLKAGPVPESLTD